MGEDEAYNFLRQLEKEDDIIRTHDQIKASILYDSIMTSNKSTDPKGYVKVIHVGTGLFKVSNASHHCPFYPGDVIPYYTGRIVDNTLQVSTYKKYPEKSSALTDEDYLYRRSINYNQVKITCGLNVISYRLKSDPSEVAKHNVYSCYVVLCDKDGNYLQDNIDKDYLDNVIEESREKLKEA